MIGMSPRISGSSRSGVSVSKKKCTERSSGRSIFRTLL